MAENHLSGQVIGVAFDGTGYGTDGKSGAANSWSPTSPASPAAPTCATCPCPAAMRQYASPGAWPSATCAMLFGPNIPDDLLASAAFPPRSSTSSTRCLRAKHLQTVETSSCGRLFDAVAAIWARLRGHLRRAGRHRAGNGRGPAQAFTDRYPFDLRRKANLYGDRSSHNHRAIVRRHCPTPAVRRDRRPLSQYARAAIVEVCRRIRNSDGLDRVCLSGGTFQNHFLLGVRYWSCGVADSEYSCTRMVPANDGGISLGAGRHRQ